LPDISILYDQSESDELGIRQTAAEMGIELGYIPFYKTAFSFDQKTYNLRTTGKDYTPDLIETKVVLNRCQSKSRRIHATTILESIGKHTLNPLTVEQNCQSKLKTLLGFSKAGIKIPRTIYCSPNAKEHLSSGRFQDNTESLQGLLQQEFQENKIVLKTDAGTHGRGVSLAENQDELTDLLNATEQGITNPSGVLAQELVPKWFYDLRIIVIKEGRNPTCYENALARGGFKEFRTNTFLGNMVVRARLPESVRRTAESCAEVLAEGAEYYVLALDAMPSIPENLMDSEDEIRQSFKDLEIPFSKVTQVKQMPNKRRNFLEYTEAINNAYWSYMDTDAYKHIEETVNNTLDLTAEKVVFHEGNACPEFWEQTRIVGGINLATSLLICAQSIIDQ
jgi:glutathione synthase/RimK-type ligase-like ATP-grasp enzyme